MSVKKRGYTEDYRRFYFADIQAIFLDQSNDSTIWNLVLGFLTGVLLIVLGFAWKLWVWENGALIAWGILVGIFAALLLTNVLKGPTCKCFIRTAVQIDPLPSLHRIRAALKAIHAISPYVESVQGSVPREKLLSIPVEFTVPRSAVQMNPAEAKLIRHERGTFHAILFGLLIWNAVIDTLDLFNRSSVLVAVGAVTLGCILIVLILAAIRQRNSDMNVSLKRTVWFTLALIIASTLGSYANSIFFALLNPGIMLNQWSLIQAMLNSRPLESTFSTILHIFSIAGCLLIGITGMILLAHHRRLYQIKGGQSPDAHRIQEEEKRAIE